jgi:putative phosphoesterase
VKLVHARKTIALSGSATRIVAVADTHGNPHPDLGKRLDAAKPDHILHGGDVGDRSVLRFLESFAPVTAVRGNIDGRAPDLPDMVTIDVGALARILLVHIAVYGPKLRADVARIAKAEDVSLVVCGHSHVPFATIDRGIAVFNPGSVGPRRFQLPICFGIVAIAPTGVTVSHVDCETGLPWKPQK